MMQPSGELESSQGQRVDRGRVRPAGQVDHVGTVSGRFEGLRSRRP